MEKDTIVEDWGWGGMGSRHNLSSGINAPVEGGGLDGREQPSKLLIKFLYDDEGIIIF